MASARLIFVVLILTALAITVSAQTVQIAWEKELDGKIFDIEVSQNYLLVGGGGNVYLFDRWGDLLWEYKTYANVTAVGISEREDYVVAASKNGLIYIFEMNGSVMKSLTYSSGDVTGFDLGKPARDISDALFPYPDKGHFLAFGKNIFGAGGKPVFVFRFNKAINKTDILGLESSASNYTDPCSRTQIFIDRVSGWGSEITVGAGTKVGSLSLGRVNSHCSTGNYTILSTTSEKIYQLTLFDFARREDSMIWQLSPAATVDIVALFRNGSYVVAGTGKKLAVYDNPSVEKPKPKLVVLANSIDYALASDFFGFLGNQGIEVIHSTAADFEQYKDEKFIVILGGPEAQEGIGEVTKQVLTTTEQSFLKTKGNKKMYVKTSVWKRGQVVMVIAGSGREQTRMAHIENREDANVRIKR